MGNINRDVQILSENHKLINSMKKLARLQVFSILLWCLVLFASIQLCEFVLQGGAQYSSIDMPSALTLINLLKSETTRKRTVIFLLFYGINVVGILPWKSDIDSVVFGSINFGEAFIASLLLISSKTSVKFNSKEGFIALLAACLLASTTASLIAARSDLTWGTLFKIQLHRVSNLLVWSILGLQLTRETFAKVRQQIRDSSKVINILQALAYILAPLIMILDVYYVQFANPFLFIYVFCLFCTTANLGSFGASSSIAVVWICRWIFEVLGIYFNSLGRSTGAIIPLKLLNWSPEMHLYLYTDFLVILTAILLKGSLEEREEVILYIEKNNVERARQLQELQEIQIKEAQFKEVVIEFDKELFLAYTDQQVNLIFRSRTEDESDIVHITDSMAKDVLNLINLHSGHNIGTVNVTLNLLHELEMFKELSTAAFSELNVVYENIIQLAPEDAISFDCQHFQDLYCHLIVGTLLITVSCI